MNRSNVGTEKGRGGQHDLHQELFSGPTASRLQTAMEKISCISGSGPLKGLGINQQASEGPCAESFLILLGKHRRGEQMERHTQLPDGENQ